MPLSFLVLSCLNLNLVEAKEKCIFHEFDSNTMIKVRVDLDFFYENGDLKANVVTRNCSKVVYSFYPDALGLDKENTYTHFVIGKLDVLSINPEKATQYIEFNTPKNRTGYEAARLKKQIKRIKLNPGEEIKGQQNITMRYKLDSGLYVIAFSSGIYDYGVGRSDKSRKKKNRLLSTYGVNYLVDLENKKKKVLYVKEIW